MRLLPAVGSVCVARSAFLARGSWSRVVALPIGRSDLVPCLQVEPPGQGPGLTSKGGPLQGLGFPTSLRLAGTSRVLDNQYGVRFGRCASEGLARYAPAERVKPECVHLSQGHVACHIQVIGRAHKCGHMAVLLRAAAGG